MVQQSQALGRSCGRFTTKVHLKTDFDGFPLAIHLTEARISRCSLLGAGTKPSVALTDKGYDAKSNRRPARARSVVPVMPVGKVTPYSPTYLPKILYKGRVRIE